LSTISGFKPASNRQFSKRGLAVALDNRPVFYPPEAVRDALLPVPTTEMGRTLRDSAIEPLREALGAAEDLDSRASHSESALIPVELWNFQYLAVTAPGHPPWLVYFEYARGKPRIVAIGLDL